MQHADSVRYLEQAGFHYKPVESPDLWTHLESRFAGLRPIGPKFASMPASFVAELIAQGEDALLEAMVELHRHTGALGRVARVIDLPYIVGTEAAIPLAKADSGRVLRLIEQPGTAQERLVHILPVMADEIPGTHHMTVIGGLYADGHTAGYFDLCPGDRPAGDGPEARGAQDIFAYLATRDEIAALTREMETKMEEIAVITRRECEAMIEKARKALG